MKQPSSTEIDLKNDIALALGALKSLTNDLSQNGFDLCFLISLNWLQGIHEPTERILFPRWKDHLALFVGNTKSIWPHFIKALGNEDHFLLENDDPLDDYTTSIINKVWNEHLMEVSQEHDNTGINKDYEIYWQQHRPGEPLLSMQHIASVTGIFHFDEIQYLCVHPTFGPWTAFRALIVLPNSFVNAKFPPNLLEKMVNSEKPNMAPNYCLENVCYEQSRAALDAALEKSNSNRQSSSNLSVKCVHESDNWKMWSEVRLVCNIGKEYQYCNDQLEYHYTAKKEILVRALSKIKT